jgi:hypothetical protein
LQEEKTSEEIARKQATLWNNVLSWYLKFSSPELKWSIAEEQAAIDDLKKSDPTNYQEIAASQLKLANSYFTSVRVQSSDSFLWSRITSGIGFIFFLAAIVFLVIELGNVSYFGAAVSAIGGVLVEVYAGLIQWQGKQAADQAKEYHIRLDRIQRFIIANSACEGLNDAEKQLKRSEIISKLAESGVGKRW